MRRDITTLDRPAVKNRSNVFISGTYDDLAYIRRAIARALETANEGPIEPHYATGANEDIREKLRRQIRMDADYYVGVFGTRYGTRVSSEEDALSYSHFEYREAHDKWKAASPPPIVVFRPDPVNGAEFYREVKEKCDAVFKNKYGDDPEALADDERRQQEFLEYVERPNGDPTLGNKISQPVIDLNDLCIRAAVWVERHKVETLLTPQPQDRLSGPLKRVEPDLTKWSLQFKQVESICRLLEQTWAHPRWPCSTPTSSAPLTRRSRCRSPARQRTTSG